MNINSMNNSGISTGYLHDEQHYRVNIQQVENVTHKQPNSRETVNEINKVKKSPMIPTPLYVFFFISQSL